MNELEKARMFFDEEESKKRVRQRCLELSIPNNGFRIENTSEDNKDYSTEEILKRAKKFADFINGGA